MKSLQSKSGGVIRIQASSYDGALFVKIVYDLLLSQKIFIIDVWLGSKLASENIEIFKMKLRWSKSSSLLQRVAFLVYKFNHSFQGKVNQFCVGSHGIVGNSLCTKSKNNSHYFNLHDSLTMHTLLYGSTLFVGSDTVRQKIFENTFFYRICPDDTSKYFVFQPRHIKC